MVVNDSIASVIHNILSGTQLGVYIDKILLLLGGVAGITLIYFIVIFYYTHKTYKEEREQTRILIEHNKKIDELYEAIKNR